MKAHDFALYGLNRLLAALSPADFALLLPHLTNVPRLLGTRLHETGDPLDAVYFPQSGMISLLAVMEDGHAIEMATVGREGAVGMMAALVSVSATGRAVVQLDGTFTQISARSFRCAVGQSAGIRDLARIYSDAQMALVYQVAGCNALHPAAARLCRWILQTQDRGDSDVFPMTQEFLSEMLGVQRTSVSALAAELQSLGLIKYRRGQIQVIDRPGLEEKACECYAAAQRIIAGVYADRSGNDLNAGTHRGQPETEILSE